MNMGKMTDQQQRRAKECAKEALKTKTNFLAIAKHIKDQFSQSYGEGWSCIVSEYGTSECRYSPTAQFIELQIGELIKIDLFKSQQVWQFQLNYNLFSSFKYCFNRNNTREHDGK